MVSDRAIQELNTIDRFGIKPTEFRNMSNGQLKDLYSSFGRHPRNITPQNEAEKWKGFIKARRRLINQTVDLKVSTAKFVSKLLKESNLSKNTLIENEVLKKKFGFDEKAIKSLRKNQNKGKIRRNQTIKKVKEAKKKDGLKGQALEDFETKYRREVNTVKVRKHKKGLKKGQEFKFDKKVNKFVMLGKMDKSDAQKLVNKLSGKSLKQIKQMIKNNEIPSNVLEIYEDKT